MFRDKFVQRTQALKTGNKMDEEDLEIWYDEEKEKALAEYMARVDKKEDHSKIETEYKKKLADLRKKYEEKYDSIIKKKKKKEESEKKIDAIKKKIIEKIPRLKK